MSVVDECASRLVSGYLLSDHIDGKLSRVSVDLPPTCHLSPNLITFAFRSSEVKRLLLDFDPHGAKSITYDI